MGLDSYLKATQHISGWEHNDGTKSKQFNAALRMAKLKMSDIDDSPSVEISFNVGYWRKANAIHSWFVENCQNGVDDCQTSYVPRNKLETLRDICKQILADHSKTALLETKRGFFFGNTEYNEWYFDDLTHTVEVIDKCLSDKFEGFEFHYHSSW